MLQTLCKHISRSLIQSDYLTVSHIHFHAFPNSRKQKHSASINLRHPYHPICPSVRNCQYLLRSPSNSKMTCCAINLRGRGLCYQFSDTSVHDPGTATAPSTSNIANSSSTSARVTWNFRVVLKAWGLEKTCQPPKFQQRITNDNDFSYLSFKFIIA